MAGWFRCFHGSLVVHAALVVPPVRVVSGGRLHRSGYRIRSRADMAGPRRQCSSSAAMTSSGGWAASSLYLSSPWGAAAGCARDLWKSRWHHGLAGIGSMPRVCVSTSTLVMFRRRARSSTVDECPSWASSAHDDERHGRRRGRHPTRVGNSHVDDGVVDLARWNSIALEDTARTSKSSRPPRICDFGEHGLVYTPPFSLSLAGQRSGRRMSQVAALGLGTRLSLPASRDAIGARTYRVASIRPGPPA